MIVIAEKIIPAAGGGEPKITRHQNVIQRLLVGDLGADVIGALKSCLASL